MSGQRNWASGPPYRAACHPYAARGVSRGPPYSSRFQSSGESMSQGPEQPGSHPPFSLSICPALKLDSPRRRRQRSVSISQLQTTDFPQLLLKGNRTKPAPQRKQPGGAGAEGVGGLRNGTHWLWLCLHWSGCRLVL